MEAPPNTGSRQLRDRNRDCQFVKVNLPDNRNTRQKCLINVSFDVESAMNQIAAWAVLRWCVRFPNRLTVQAVLIHEAFDFRHRLLLQILTEKWRHPLARVPLEIGYRRALCLRCPLCGNGKLFCSFFRMNERCSECDFKFEREPGYFLGSTYINYGWTSLTLTIAYIVFHVALGYPNSYVVPPLVLWFVFFPMFFHRYARAFWLTFDCFWDHTELPNDPPNPDQPS